MADHRRLVARPARLSPDDAARRTTMRVLLLFVTLVLIVFITAATVSDIVHHGVSWLDIVALLVVALFTTGICGALWESLRRER